MKKLVGGIVRKKTLFIATAVLFLVSFINLVLSPVAFAAQAYYMVPELTYNTEQKVSFKEDGETIDWNCGDLGESIYVGTLDDTIFAEFSSNYKENMSVKKRVKDLANDTPQKAFLVTCLGIQPATADEIVGALPSPDEGPKSTPEQISNVSSTLEGYVNNRQVEYAADLLSTAIINQGGILPGNIRDAYMIWVAIDHAKVDEMINSAQSNDLAALSKLRSQLEILKAWGDANPTDVYVVQGDDDSPGSQANLEAKIAAISQKEEEIQSPPLSPSSGTDTCRAEGIGWILCPVATALGALGDGLYGMVSKMLVNRTAVLTDQKVFGTYTSFLGYANILLGIFFLIIIIGTMFGDNTGNFLASFNYKKALPKLVMFAILVNIAFYICAALFDISNIIGNSVSSILDANTQPINLTIDGGNTATLSGSDSDNLWQELLGGIASAAIVGGVGVGLFYFAPGVVSSLLMMAVIAVLGFILAIFVAFLCLMIRQAALLLFIIISPIAFALAVLPNTEKYFKSWWSMFLKLLFFYPFVAAVFFGTKMAAGILANLSDMGFLWQMMCAVLTAAPLFFLPKLFQSAVAGLGKLGGNITSKLSGMSGAITGAANKKWQDSDMRKRGIAARKNLAAQRKATLAATKGQSFFKRSGAYIGTAANRGVLDDARASQENANIKQAAEQMRATWARDPEKYTFDAKKALLTGPNTNAIEKQAAMDELDGLLTEDHIFDAAADQNAFKDRNVRAFLGQQMLKKGLATGPDAGAYMESNGTNDFVKVLSAAGEIDGTQNADAKKKAIQTARAHAVVNKVISDKFNANEAGNLSVKEVAALNAAEGLGISEDSVKGAKDTIHRITEENVDNKQFRASTSKTWDGLTKFSGYSSPVSASSGQSEVLEVHGVNREKVAKLNDQQLEQAHTKMSQKVSEGTASSQQYSAYQALNDEMGRRTSPNQPAPEAEVKVDRPEYQQRPMDKENPEI